MKDTDFSILAEKTIAMIADIIEDEDEECLIDVDFNGDILNLTTDKGVFVINKHSAAKEVWLSSPISGPYHFFYTQEGWQSKNSARLRDLLQEELQINFNKLEL